MLSPINTSWNDLTSEQKQESLSRANSLSPTQNPEEYEYFAFVVDSKVSAIFVASKELMSDYINAWSSNPVTVKLTSQEKNVVLNGWNFNSETREFSQSS